MLSLGVLCWSFVAWLELAALGFRGEGFRRYLCYRLSLEVGFCVSLVVRVVDAASRFLGAWFPVAAVASCGRYAGVMW